MKILFITHYDNMYGANKALFKLIRALKEEHGEEPMLVIPAEGEMSLELKKIGVTCIISPVTQWQAVYASPLRFFVKKVIRKRQIQKEVKTLFERLKEERIEVIHSNSSVIGLGAMLAKKLGCKHVWHIREFSQEHFRMEYFYSPGKVKAYYENADCVVAISESLAENYRRRYPNAKVIRIYDGVSGDYPNPKEKNQEEPIRFCYVGYIFPMKQQLSLVEACKQLKEEKITDYELYLVGDGKEEYRLEIENAIRKYDLSQIKLTGYQSDVHKILSGMDVGMIASKYEGFGLVTVEYMLHGLPVIGYNSGGTGEIILDGITGYLYTEPKELVTAMKQLMQDSKRRKRFGEAGRIRAKECFSEEQNAIAMLELYHKLKKGEL